MIIPYIAKSINSICPSPRGLYFPEIRLNPYDINLHVLQITLDEADSLPRRPFWPHGRSQKARDRPYFTPQDADTSGELFPSSEAVLRL